MYQSYKVARDLSWQVLIETGIDKLPVNLDNICSYYGITVLSYSTLKARNMLISEMNQSNDGFSFKIKNKHFIVYNDSIKSAKRIRFTIAHELGHILLNHNSHMGHYRTVQKYEAVEELQADTFARDLLMPATVLAGLNVQTKDDIVRLCNVSEQAAQLRMMRLKELYQRDKFNKHPLEKQVYKHFKKFIDTNK